MDAAPRFSASSEISARRASGSAILRTYAVDMRAAV